ncbi:MAG: KilA-N domain-containing protein [Microcoleus sp.]
MSNIILHQFGSGSVGFDDKDGYIDATAMAAAYKVKTGKRRNPQDWARTKQAIEFINVVSLTTGIPVVNLITTKEGRGGGTGYSKTYDSPPNPPNP